MTQSFSRLRADELRDLMGLDAELFFTRVYRFAKANPLPLVGHLPRMRTARESLARFGGLHLAGAAFGQGIPECIRQAGEVARAIVPR